MIKATNLTKYYGEFLAVDHINFEVHKGEIFGFLGPNGAGKTTTIRMLTGILKPSDGEIRIMGLDARKDMIRIKEMMGVVPEMANPYIDLTAMQNIYLMGQLYGMSKREIIKRGEELLQIFGLIERKDKKVRFFSKGMRQRLSLAMAFLPDPELLFLDEPTSGLDVMSARLIKRIIREENRKGKTIFLSTHNMNVANELCTRIAIINHGKIVAVGTPEKIKEMSMAYGIVEVSFYPFIYDSGYFTSLGKVEILGDKLKIYTNDVDHAVKRVVKYAMEKNLRIVSLQTKKPTLEDVFVHLISGDKNV